MSIVAAPPGQTRRRREGRRARRDERRRLERQDALSSRLAELTAIHALLGQAGEVVDSGWVQGAWFTDAGACLVGAVVQAAGGPAQARSQIVQRTLDLTWHTLREDPGRPVRWCPGPCVRTMHVLELTFWNDAPARAKGEVVDLLAAARETTHLQSELCRSEREALTAV